VPEASRGVGRERVEERLPPGIRFAPQRAVNGEILFRRTRPLGPATPNPRLPRSRSLPAVGRPTVQRARRRQLPSDLGDSATEEKSRDQHAERVAGRENHMAAPSREDHARSRVIGLSGRKVIFAIDRGPMIRREEVGDSPVRAFLRFVDEGQARSASRILPPVGRAPGLDQSESPCEVDRVVACRSGVDLLRNCTNRDPSASRRIHTRRMGLYGCRATIQQLTSSARASRESRGRLRSGTAPRRADRAAPSGRRCGVAFADLEHRYPRASSRSDPHREAPGGGSQYRQFRWSLLFTTRKSRPGGFVEKPSMLVEPLQSADRPGEPHRPRRASVRAWMAVASSPEHRQQGRQARAALLGAAPRRACAAWLVEHLNGLPSGLLPCAGMALQSRSS
jgi:hypothetical protein